MSCSASSTTIPLEQQCPSPKTMSHGSSFLESPCARSCSQPPLQPQSILFCLNSPCSTTWPPQPRGSGSSSPCCGPKTRSNTSMPTHSPQDKTSKLDPAPSCAPDSVQSEANLSFSWEDEEDNKKSPYCFSPRYACSKCGKQFFNRVKFQTHETTCIQDVIVQCKTCHRVFSNPTSVISHQCKQLV